MLEGILHVCNTLQLTSFSLTVHVIFCRNLTLIWRVHRPCASSAIVWTAMSAHWSVLAPLRCRSFFCFLS